LANTSQENVFSNQINDQQALRRPTAPSRELHKEATKMNSKSEERIATDDQSSTPHQQHHRMIRNKGDI
jgi:hypothetical protein